MDGVMMDAQRSFAPEPKNSATILCADCGAPVDGTLSGAFCYDCIKLKTDVTGGIQREAILLMCRDCDRWLSPPTTWVVAAPESRELLALCLKKLRGLNKLRIIDAGFIWTEPHSRRIKVKITVQSEINEGAIMQQSFEVEYTQNYNQCPDCAKSYTHNTWRACVQIRQKVPHKRTFLYLEQLILKHGAHKDTINIKEVHDGIDFFFAQRNHAVGFCDFLKAVIPVNIKRSEELISHDIHTSTKNYKFSFSCEIVPICKDDLVVLPIPLAKKIGNISPLTLCTRIGTSIQLLDPSTLQTADVATDIYWRTPFRPLADVQELTEFIVLDIEPLGKSVGRHFLAEATVARASDMGVNDTTYYCRTHLGGILHVGDSVMGYLLSNTNFNSDLFDVLESNNKYAAAIPDVMLVKKYYQRSKKNKNKRNWRVKRINKDEGEMLPRKQDQEKMERDFEMFLQDVEEDQDLRATMALYKAQQEQKQRDADAMETESSLGDDEDEGLQIPMEQLLDDFEEMKMGD